jgi:hypothetical protein
MERGGNLITTGTNYLLWAVLFVALIFIMIVCIWLFFGGGVQQLTGVSSLGTS